MIPPFIDPPPAIVHGYSARVLAGWLRREWDRGDFDWVPADGREQLYATIRAIEFAGDAWARRRISAVGNSEAPRTEIGAPLINEMSIAEAAAVLDLTTRRVRTLAAEGLGRKVGSVWVCDAAAVLALAESRSAA